MIQAINSKYCKNNLIQLMPYTTDTQLILSADEIILLKLGNKILVNKYTNHPNRSLFPFSDKEQNDRYHFTEIFEYNKMYLNYGGQCGFSFCKNYFFRGTNRALFLEESLPCDEQGNTENIQDLTRNEIEHIFDSDNYDIMVIMDVNGIISFVKSKNDNIKLGLNIIPSNEEIIKREVDGRIGDYNFVKKINPDFASEEEYKKASTPKVIDEIKEFNICGSALFGTYSHMFLTSKNGKFNLMWFKIELIEKDKFRFITSPIKIIEPTVDDAINYSANYYIDFTPEPYQPPKAFKEVMTKKNQQFSVNSVLNILEQNKKREETEKEEINIRKTLKRIFKKK